MARVAAFIPDLLFGSRVVAALQADGHEVALTGDADGLGRELRSADVLIVDLTADPDERITLTRSASVPTLAFYSHVEADVRDAAEAAGFDLVVPRSRMAREGAALVERLLPG